MATLGQSFPRASRLLTGHEFSRVFDENRRKSSTRYALLLALETQQPQSRLGLVIAKKNIRFANQRNRVKRIVREYFRCNPLSSSYDLVFLARRGLGDLSNEQIRAQLNELWRKLDKPSRVQ